jgi:hypothetical protein
MSASGNDGSIGVQQILPRSGTAWDNQNPTPPSQDNSAPENNPPPPPERGAKPDGVGQIVDRLV